jgi:hypothetical protein
MSCETIRIQLHAMLYGELSFDEEEIVHQHLDGCSGCRAEMELARKLHAAFDAAEPGMPPDLLQNCRRALRVDVAALSEQALPQRRGLVERLRSWISLGGVVWKPAAALGILVLGFAAGRYSPENTAVVPFARPEPVASRVRYVQPEGSDRVQIVVEEVRQRVLEGELNNGEIRSLLVSAAREARDPGVRVETMDLLKSQSESADVRRALLAALQHDSNPGVRLKAIEALRISAADDRETRTVLANVLLTDNNPGVRTQAIDLLVRKREPAMVGVLQELMTREENSYVRQKCQRALSEMNASVETF